MPNIQHGYAPLKNEIKSNVSPTIPSLPPKNLTRIRLSRYFPSSALRRVSFLFLSALAECYRRDDQGIKHTRTLEARGLTAMIRSSYRLIALHKIEIVGVVGVGVANE